MLRRGQRRGGTTHVHVCAQMPPERLGALEAAPAVHAALQPVTHVLRLAARVHSERQRRAARKQHWRLQTPARAHVQRLLGRL